MCPTLLAPTRFTQLHVYGPSTPTKLPPFSTEDFQQQLNSFRNDKTMQSTPLMVSKPDTSVGMVTTLANFASNCLKVNPEAAKGLDLKAPYATVMAINNTAVELRILDMNDKSKDLNERICSAFKSAYPPPPLLLSLLEAPKRDSLFRKIDQRNQKTYSTPQQLIAPLNDFIEKKGSLQSSGIKAFFAATVLGNGNVTYTTWHDREETPCFIATA